MKYLVFGSTGMAGHLISKYLIEKGHDVVGFSRHTLHGVKSIIGDAKNTELIKEIISNGDYNWIINCIGVLNQFADIDKENAVYVNSYFPHFLNSLTERMKTNIIHISTDCVFSGKKGLYKEFDFKDGTSFYDRTKALGELIDTKNITIRTSIIGPDMNIRGIGLLNWFMTQNKELFGYSKAIWTGITTLELAKVIESISQSNERGLVNMVNNEIISKYDLLILLNKYLRNNEIKIIPSETIAINKSLVRTNFDFNYDIPSYEFMINELSIWMKEHIELYPHYRKIIEVNI